MRVLVLHNRYRQSGGEDGVARSEAETLRAHGIEAVEEAFDNEAGSAWRGTRTVQLACAAAWSHESSRRVRRICAEFQPDVAHVHNFWMRLSPSVHRACQDAGVPTVQTLHNFRLLCTNALFLRNGKICEDCLGKTPWRGVVRRCYRDSFLASAAVARMIVSNRGRDTWRRDVDAFIALTEHSRAKFIAGGLPAARIFVKPNFVEDPGQPASAPSASDVVLYAGRLSKEKGVAALLSAWAGAALGRHGRLVIAGDGPERATLEDQASLLELAPPEVTFAGYQPAPKLHALIEGARAVVVPSIWYETFGRVVIETFCHARPAVVSDIGAIGELVHHGGTGLKFPPGDAAALGEALRTILGDDGLADRLGGDARAEYLAKYTPERNFEMLMRIYRLAIERKGNALPEMLRSFEPATPTVHKEPAEVAHA